MSSVCITIKPDILFVAYGSAIYLLNCNFLIFFVQTMTLCWQSSSLLDTGTAAMIMEIDNKAKIKAVCRCISSV